MTRRVSLTPASAIKPRPVRWAWDTAPPATEPARREGRVPVGSLTLAVGRAGVGKSQFAVWMAARVTTGTLPGIYWGQPHSVIYATSEDSWSMTVVPRLIAAGANLDRVFRMDVVDDEDIHARLTLPSDISLIEATIRSEAIALIVLDPLLSVIDAAINDYRAREVREALEPLVRMADGTGVALLGLAHFTKANGSDPLLLISGSAAFGQLIRAGIGFARDDEADETYVLSTIKNNLGREELPSLAYRFEPQAIPTAEGDAWVSRLAFTGEASSRSVRDILRDRATTDDERGDQSEAAEWIVAFLADLPTQTAPASEVLAAGERAGFARRTLQRARKRAGVRTGKLGMAGGWAWTLVPEGATEDAVDDTRTGMSPTAPSVASSEDPDTELTTAEALLRDAFGDVFGRAFGDEAES